MKKAQEEERHVQLPGSIGQGLQREGALSWEEEPKFPVDPGSEFQEEDAVHSDAGEGKRLSLVGAYSWTGREGSWESKGARRGPSWVELLYGYKSNSKLQNDFDICLETVSMIIAKSFLKQ